MMVGRIAFALLAFLALSVFFYKAPSAKPAPEVKPGYSFQADSPLAKKIVENTILESNLPRGSSVVRVRKAAKTRISKGFIEYTDEMALVQAIRRFGKGAASEPTIPFRAVMIDVARRYHSISTLKTLSRWCSEANIPILQLHLTDDQNWMFPSQIVKGADGENTHKKPAYTLAELKELADFAQLRGVTVIPEIDMPGHNRLLVRHRPDLKLAGTSNVVDITSASVRKTMKSLIGEVAKAFPAAPFIHLGGDEVDHGGRERDYVDFLAEMAEEVLSQGKKPIVWEGFGQSDFAKSRIPKETLVVAWEGPYYPASKLVDDGFQVINAGWDPYYVVNHYPYDMYTLVPLERILKHDPRRFGVVDWAGPADRSFDFPKSHLLKGSLMCWWEGQEWNTATILPARILALGDRLASPTRPIPYGAWKKRFAEVERKIERLAHPFTVNGDRTFENSTQLSLSARDKGVQLAYRLDGETPTVTDLGKPNTFEVNETGVLSVMAYRDKKPVGEVKWIPLRKVVRTPHLAVGAKVTTDGEDDPHFSADKAVDGVSDVLGSYWLAYPNPRTLKMDLGQVHTVSRIEVVAFWAQGGVARYKVSLSEDGKTWIEAVTAIYQTAPATPEGYRHDFTPTKARYIRFSTRIGEGFPPRISKINEIRVY